MSVFRKYSYWIDSGKYTAIQKFTTLSMGIVSFMLLTRILGPGSFGVWGLFLLIAGITETARTALIKNAYVRFSHQTKVEEVASLQTASLILSLTISSVLALFFILFSDIISYYLNASDLSIMLHWYALSIVVSTLFSHLEIIMTAKMDFRGICWMYCCRQIVLLLPIIFCYTFKISVTPSVLSVFYLISIVAGISAGLFFSRQLRQWDITEYKVWIKKTWHFGKYVLGNNISSLLFRGTDNFVTSNFFGVVVAGQYNACLRIGNLIDLPSQVLGDILYPKAAKFNKTDKAKVKNIYEKTVGASLVFSIPALLILFVFPELILRILAGPEFVKAASVLRITALFGFLLPFLKQFGTIMDATGSPRLNFAVMLLAFCVNVVANLVGVFWWGWVGAAIGTLTTYCIIFTITQIIMKRRFGVDIRRIFINTISFYKGILQMSRTYLNKV